MDILAIKLTIWIFQVMLGVYCRSLHANSTAAFSLAEGLWAAFGLYWLISALRRKSVKERELNAIGDAVDLLRQTHPIPGEISQFARRSGRHKTCAQQSVLQ